MTEMEMLRSAGTMQKYKRGQPVFSQYDIGNEMYVVLKGTFGVYINTFTGFTSRVAGISQGSFFGEMAVIDGSPRSATIVSEDEDAVVVMLNKESFKQLLEKAPNMTSAIMTTLRNRALITSESVSRAGKAAPGLPPLLAGEEAKDASNIMCYLTMLADNIRNMNNTLFIEDGESDDLDEVAALVKAEEAKEKEDAKKAEEEKTRATLKEPTEPEDLEDNDIEEAEEDEDDDLQDGVIRLLPKGYKPYNITDLKINTNTLRDVRVVCPYCHKAIKIDVPIHGQLGDKEELLDGRIKYSNLNILLYTNAICPNCKFCDTNMEFSIPRETLDPPKYEEIQFYSKEEFFRYDRSLNRTVDEAILSYYLNLECLKRVTNNPLRYANAWIRLYWLYSDQGSTDFAKEAAKNAYNYYSKYYENSSKSMSADDQIKLNAILGEMSVVLENYEKASDYYTMIAVTGKGLKSDFVKQCDKRRKEIQEMQ